MTERSMDSDSPPHMITRRTALRTGAAALAAGAMSAVPLTPSSRDAFAAEASPAATTEPSPPTDLALRFAVKYSMVRTGQSMTDNFRLLKRIGFDGVELDSPNGYDRAEVLRARDESGLPIHGVVDSIHWQVRLSSPDAAARARAREGLETAILDARAYGGSSVLLVPGVVADAASENGEQVWERSIVEIRKVLPLAAEHGIHILIENVWNRFLYDHDGPATQTADKYAAYIDAFGSPWVGAYHDLGNHRKYGKVHEWVRTLGRRIVKLDVKDWGVTKGWAKIGDGDVDWPQVRRALAAINFTGWATAEVAGGGEDRLRDIKRRMDRALRSSDAEPARTENAVGGE